MFPNPCTLVQSSLKCPPPGDGWCRCWVGGGGGPGRWTGCSTPGPQSGGSSGRPGCPDSAAFETPADPASYGNNLVLKNILCAYRRVTVPVRLSMQLRHDSAYKFIRSVSRFFLEGGGSQRKRGWGRLVAIIIANPHHMVNVFSSSNPAPFQLEEGALTPPTCKLLCSNVLKW